MFESGCDTRVARSTFPAWSSNFDCFVEDTATLHLLMNLHWVVIEKKSWNFYKQKWVPSWSSDKISEWKFEQQKTSEDNCCWWQLWRLEPQPHSYITADHVWDEMRTGTLRVQLCMFVALVSQIVSCLDINGRLSSTSNADGDVDGSGTCFQQGLRVVVTSVEVWAGSLHVTMEMCFRRLSRPLSNRDCMLSWCLSIVVTYVASNTFSCISQGTFDTLQFRVYFHSTTITFARAL